MLSGDSGLEFACPDELDEFHDAATFDASSRDDEETACSTELDVGSSCSLHIGSRLGRYSVSGVLGEGQYARIYRGYDPVLDRAVALKVLRPGLLRRDRMRERFLGEARALARLSHPRIVPVFDAGVEADLCFIAMGLIEGESLAELRDREVIQLGARRVGEIVADLADALAYAHHQGIVHRDIKPMNILLDQAGQAYLMDFGIACRSESRDVWADGGRRTGSPAYVAPEVALGEQHVILPTIDQYSLGVALLRTALRPDAVFRSPALRALPGREPRTAFAAIHQSGHPAPPRRHLPEDALPVSRAPLRVVRRRWCKPEALARRIRPRTHTR